MLDWIETVPASQTFVCLMGGVSLLMLLVTLPFALHVRRVKHRQKKAPYPVEPVNATGRYTCAAQTGSGECGGDVEHVFDVDAGTTKVHCLKCGVSMTLRRKT